MKQSLKINKVNLLLFICLLLAAILFLLAMDNDRAHRTYLYRDCGIDKRDVRIPRQNGHAWAGFSATAIIF